MPKPMSRFHIAMNDTGLVQSLVNREDSTPTRRAAEKREKQKKRKDWSAMLSQTSDYDSKGYVQGKGIGNPEGFVSVNSLVRLDQLVQPHFLSTVLKNHDPCFPTKPYCSPSPTAFCRQQTAPESIIPRNHLADQVQREVLIHPVFCQDGRAGLSLRIHVATGLRFDEDRVTNLGDYRYGSEFRPRSGRRFKNGAEHSPKPAAVQ